MTMGLAMTLFAIAPMTFAQPPGVVFPDYYPEEFSGVGRIVSIDGDKVVIDDQLYYLSQRVTYHTLIQEYAFKSVLKPGMLVGFVRGSVNQIVSLYVIQE
jgi:hypothetical protein